MKINIASNEIIHFVGIGGIGMSGLAQIMKNMGFLIQGSDLNKNKNTERLTKLGIKVYYGHNQKNLKKATLVVISSAIKSNNLELKFAKSQDALWIPKLCEKLEKLGFEIATGDIALNKIKTKKWVIKEYKQLAYKIL